MTAKKIATLVVCLLTVTLLVAGTYAAQEKADTSAGSQEDTATASEKSSPDEATGEKQSEQESQGERTYTDEKEQARVTIPAGEWKMVTPENMDEQGGGCMPARGAPEGFIVTTHLPESRVVASVTRRPKEYLARNEEDLRTFAAQMKDVVSKKGGEGTKIISSELAKKDDTWVHTLEFSAPSGPLGGCGALGGADAPKRMHYRLWDYFIRPEGKDARLYRIGTATPEGEYENYRETFQSFAESFEFTGNRADEFFAPDAPEEKLPTVDVPEGACGEWGSTSIFLFIAVLAVLWWWSRKMAGNFGSGESEAPSSGKSSGE